jgi:hypothetical protein
MILRNGTNNEEVKKLQIYLNNEGFIVSKSGPGSPGNETKYFGPATEAAVKKWQKANGLKDDGIVGSITLNAMGLISTDISEEDDESGLTIKESFLPKGEYFAGPTPKSWLYLHHTAGWNNPFNTISNWGRDKRGAVATEFVLGGQKITNNDTENDGVLVKAFPTGGYGWHLGTGNNLMHRNSVGIEVCNFGQLTKGGFFKMVNGKRTWIKGKDDSFYTYVGTEANSDQVVELDKEFRGFKFWHKYSDKQIEVLRDWILYIAERDNIDVRKGLVELIKEKGAHEAFDFFDIKYVTNNPGLWNHTNVRKDKFDMFPQQELVDMLLSL